MTQTTKRRLVLRCALAVAGGVALAGFLALWLSVYANDQDPRGGWVASDVPVAFPGSDAELREMADSLLGQRLDRTGSRAGREK